MTIKIEKIFYELNSKFTENSSLKEQMWSEIFINYSEKNRHYHTLSHLTCMISLLEEIKNKIKDWEAVLFAVFYHDIIYKSDSNQNEEMSADLAKLRLTGLSFPENRIRKCTSLILATKGHSNSNDNDTNLFTDADLSILGQSWDIYSEYSKQIREEYSIYPDMIYNPGRKKVLAHFLEMSPIFKTQYFFDKFEIQAKKNLIAELKSL